VRPTSDLRREQATPLIALAVSYMLLVIIGVGAITVLPHELPVNGMGVLNPFGPAEISRGFFAANPDAVRVSALFCFVSSIPLVIYTAVVVSRLRSLGLRDPGVHAAFAGGLAASGGLAAAALFLWMLSVPDAAASLPVAHTLHFLVFLSGGPAFAVGMGLMAGGVSVSIRRARVLPTWVIRLGFLLAATGALSALGLLVIPLTAAIPITRVGGFAWLAAVGAFMPDRPAPARG
jgi:hypothetical protein